MNGLKTLWRVVLVWQLWSLVACADVLSVSRAEYEAQEARLEALESRVAEGEAENEALKLELATWQAGIESLTQDLTARVEALEAGLAAEVEAREALEEVADQYIQEAIVTVDALYESVAEVESNLEIESLLRQESD